MSANPHEHIRTRSQLFSQENDYGNDKGEEEDAEERGEENLEVSDGDFDICNALRVDLNWWTQCGWT